HDGARLLGAGLRIAELRIAQRGPLLRNYRRVFRSVGDGEAGGAAIPRAMEEQAVPGPSGEGGAAVRDLGGRPFAGPCRHHARVHEADALAGCESGVKERTKYEGLLTK